MDPLVQVTVRLQELALRLFGLLLAVGLGAYLVQTTVRPMPPLLDLLAFGTLGVALFRHVHVLVSRPAEARKSETVAALFTTLTVAAYLAVLELPGGLDGPFYPIVLGLMLVLALHAEPPTVALTVVFAALLESTLRVLHLDQGAFDIAPRVGFLVGFALLNSALFRGEIERVKKLSRGRVQGELERMKEAARAYRLTDAPAEVEEWSGHELTSAAGELGHAARYALGLLRTSLRLDAVVLYSLEGKRLRVFESLTRRELAERPLSTDDGVFSACFRQRELIAVSGARAGRHAIHYRLPAVVGALAVVPLLEGEHPRGVLLVDRELDAPFSEAELGILKEASAFLLRAMESERQFSALSRASREQAKLYRAAKALAAATTEALVIEAAVESAREVASFDFAAVTLFDKKTSTHEICAVSGDEAEGLVERSFRHNAGLVSMVVANRHPLPYRGEYEPSRQTVFARGIEPPKMPSLFVLPLLVHERVLGTLVLGSSKAGAFSETVRPTLEVLASHMAVSLSNARMLKRLEEQATTDGMTGLLNKRTLTTEAERRVASAQRFKKPLSVLVTDIDHFKKVNDTYGHDVGDVVIKGLGDVLRRVKRDTDIVGRFGGEEFVIVCEETDEEGAKNLAERIRRELAATTFQTELGPLSVTCSVGVAPFPAAGQDWAQLFKATDEALYVSKRSGRNRVTVWSPRLRGASAA